MSKETSPQWRPEPEPQNELERLISKAALDPALRGKLFRMLWEAEVFIYVPPHPELVGEHTKSIDEGLQWLAFQDEQGPFVPVFTSEVCAKFEMRNLNGTKAMILQLPARVAFGFFNNGRTTVRVMAAGGGTASMPPQVVKAFAEGRLTESRPDTGDAERTFLTPVPADKVPMKLREGIRVFCAKRRTPIGVYVFHPGDVAAGTVDTKDLRIVLWLRTTDDHFYNDFSLMVGALVPKHLEWAVGVMTPDDEEGIAFLQKQTPLWPIVKGE